LRRDLPLGHPEFGRLEVCSCRLPGVREEVRRRLFSLSHLDELGGLTFDSFSPRGRRNLPAYNQESLQAAYQRAQHYAHTLEGWLLIQGGYGCGKTHLAAAIANECVGLGVPTLFLTVPDLLDTLRFSFDAEEVTFEQRFEQLRTAPFLVLDDFGTQNATEWSREKLFQILNFRYINRLPTVVTTNLELDEVEGRMRSRLSDTSLVTPIRIEAPDYRRAADDTGHHELSSLGLHAQQDFGAWSSREGEGLPAEHLRNLKKAFDSARKFAQAPEGWLVLTGTYGTGKTHLAAAIANDRAKQGFPGMFVPVPDLLDHLRATFSPASNVPYDRRFDEIRTTPLLVLDDLGTQATTPWAQEKLFQLLNHRYNAALPTVITTAKSVDELAKSDPRLVSRMLDTRLCTIFAITAPSYLEGRLRRKKR